MPSLIASTKCAATTAAQTTPGTSPAINTTGANLFIAWVCDYALAGFLTTPADSQNAPSSWVGLTSIGALTSRGQLFYMLNPSTSASHTFDVVPGGGATYPSMYVEAWSMANGGIVAPGAYNTTNEGGAAGVSLAQTPGLTPPAADCVVVMGAVNQEPDTFAVADFVTAAIYTISQQSPINAGVAFGGALAHTVPNPAALIYPQWGWTTSQYVQASMAMFLPGGSAGGGDLNAIGSILIADVVSFNTISNADLKAFNTVSK